MSTGKLVLWILAAVGVVALCATVFQRLRMSILLGSPLTLALYTVAVFLLGVFLGTISNRR